MMAIWHPRIGQRVGLHYRKSLVPFTPHGERGTVRIVGSGRKAVNVAVQLDSGRLVCVPRGNLVEDLR